MLGRSLGPYKILEPLGAGGTSVVYLADDQRFGRRVAIKVLPPAVAEDAARLARFERAARATMALNHPGICTVYDLGIDEGRAFLVMEALAGQTLEALIGGRPIEVKRLLEIGIEVAAALADAHARGIIHGDLNAASIFVTDADRVKIVDFGLAEALRDRSVAGVGAPETSLGADRLFDTRESARRASYRSPERARGGELDSRADLFSFGVVLYEMATGALPFAGATDAAAYEQVLDRDPVSPARLNPRLPTGLVQLIGMALHKDPAARIGSAGEVRVVLEEIRRAPGSLDSVLPLHHVSTGDAVFGAPSRAAAADAAPEDAPESSIAPPEPTAET